MLFSHDYSTAAHFDLDIGYAIGLWLLHHEDSCAFNDDRCVPNWYFYLPQHHLAIKLKHGTVIVWNSAELAHCSLYEKQSVGCNVTAMCVVTQIQKRYAQAVIKEKKS